MATLTSPALAPLLRNGLLPRDATLETYPVRPGGATMIVLRGDDRARIIDHHGGQTAEVTVLGAPAGLPQDADATVLRGLASVGAKLFISALAARGLNSDQARCARLFGPTSDPGSEVTLVAEGETALFVAAPGGRLIDGDVPATELLVEVRRWRRRGLTSGSIPPRRSAIRSAPASTSRSSTSKASSARTSWPFTAPSSKPASSAAWIQR
jgi:hypothetical protein